MKLEQYENYLAGDFPGDIIECGQPGPMDCIVREYLSEHHIEADPTAVREYLHEVNAGWNLIYHHENMERLIWLAACDIRENGEWFFSH